VIRRFSCPWWEADAHDGRQAVGQFRRGNHYLMAMHSKKARLGSLLGLILLAVVVQIPYAPTIDTNMRRDSGAFAYIGSRLLRGDIPYADLWDHKPPAIYYLNAVALRVLGEGRWAIWALGLAVSCTCVVLFFSLVGSDFGVPLGVFASAIFVTSMHSPLIYEGGNLTEEYAMLPQLLILWSASKYFYSRSPRWLLLSGAGTTACFAFKQSTIVLGIVMFLVLWADSVASRDLRQGFVESIHFLAGVVVPLLALAVHLRRLGVWDEFLDAVFRYNSLYIRSIRLSLASRITNAGFVLSRRPPAGVFLLLDAIALFVWVLSLRRHGRRANPWSNATAVAILSTPLEFALLFSLGYIFAHYMLTVVPASCVAIAYLLSHARRRSKVSKQARPRLFTALIAGLVVVALLVPYVHQYARKRPRAWAATSAGQQRAVVDFVRSHTHPGEQVYVWGAEPAIYFLSQREGASRYFYVYPLQMPDYDNSTRLSELLQDLGSVRPSLIIDTGTAPPIDWEAREAWQALRSGVEPSTTRRSWDEFAPLYEWVEANYAKAVTIGEWTVYEQR
jgi:4-amino-4-deoxy-L-arabinose transferase-like glycosyltransferase